MGQITNLLPLHLPSCSASRMLHDGAQRLCQMRGLDIFAPRQICDRAHQPLTFNFFRKFFSRNHFKIAFTVSSNDSVFAGTRCFCFARSFRAR